MIVCFIEECERISFGNAGFWHVFMRICGCDSVSHVDVFQEIACRIDVAVDFAIIGIPFMLQCLCLESRKNKRTHIVIINVGMSCSALDKRHGKSYKHTLSVSLSPSGITTVWNILSSQLRHVSIQLSLITSVEAATGTSEHFARLLCDLVCAISSTISNIVSIFPLSPFSWGSKFLCVCETETMCFPTDDFKTNSTCLYFFV